MLHITTNMPGVGKELLSFMKDSGLTSLLLLPLFGHNQTFGLIEVLNSSLRKEIK